MKKILSLLLLCLMFMGCALKTWMKIDSPHMVGPEEAFSINVPIGWVHAAFVENKIFLTFDGSDIHGIWVRKVPHKNAFPRIQKDADPKLLPSELAELYIAEVKQSYGLANFDIVENRPATVSGKDAFRVHIRSKNSDGLRIDHLSYGLVDEAGFYVLAYRSPTLHFFNRDLPAFEKIVESFTILDGGGNKSVWYELQPEERKVYLSQVDF